MTLGAGRTLKVKIVLVGADRYSGLCKDADIVRDRLTRLGHSATIVKRPVKKTLVWRAMFSKRLRTWKIDGLLHAGLRARGALRRAFHGGLRDHVTVHLEYTPPRDLSDGARQLFLPNPEWFTDRHTWALPLIDLVLCKTANAVEPFDRAGAATAYVGFTSHDCRVPGVVPDRSKWLHIASNGHQKGTDEVVEAWRRNPHWPTLTVVAGRRRKPIEPASNVHIIDEWLSDSDLRILMQSCGVHVCTSNAEGYGHTIVESMSCGVLVLTTDLAPMNELVGPDRGVLVGVTASSPMGWFRRAIIEQSALAEAVEQAMAFSDDEHTRRAAAARHWFEQNDLSFDERLRAVTDGLLDRSATLTR